MWVVYRKADKVIVGATAETGHDPEKEVAVQEIVDGLVEPGDRGQYDAVQVTDRDRALKILNSMMSRTLKVEGSKGRVDVAEDEGEASLMVTVEGAQDFHPVDQTPLIPADPSSFVTIRIQKIDARGKPLTRKTVDKDVLWLRTDAGFLRADPAGTAPGTMPPDVRSVTLAAGVASFRLYAEPAKRLATVQILSTEPRFNTGVRVELV